MSMTLYWIIKGWAIFGAVSTVGWIAYRLIRFGTLIVDDELIESGEDGEER